MNIAALMPRDLASVASERIHALWQRRAFTQAALAKAINRPISAVNRIVHGKQQVTLRVLEAVGNLVGVSPAELIIDPSVDLKAVTPLEAQLLRYFRKWPQPTRESFIAFASFFADEDPVLHDQRVAHEQLRRLKSEAVRRRAYAYLTFLTEGGLTPDLQEAFGLLDSVEPQSSHTAKATPTKKRRRA